MLTSEIAKGTEVRLRNGFRAVVQDNQKRMPTRMCKVYGSEFGMYDEMGSVYSTDIVQANVGGAWVAVTPTDSQKKGMANRSAFGF